MKKLFLITVLCLSVTTLLAKSLPDNTVKTEKVFSVEKFTDAKQCVSFEVKAVNSDFAPSKRSYDFNKEFIPVPEQFLNVFLVQHNYSYREKLKSNYLIDQSRLISSKGLKNKSPNYC